MNKYRRQLIAVAERKGLAVQDIVDSKNKLHVLVLLRNGDHRKIFVAKTPSDYRAIKNYGSFCSRVSQGLV